MNNDENNRRRPERDPFDFIRDDNETDRIFNALDKLIREMFKDISFEEIQPGRSFIRGVNVHIGPDGKPKIQEFGNFSRKTSNGEVKLSKEREPIVDVIENHENVAITVEMPGVEKKDITLNVKDQKLDINVDGSGRNYHKIVDLPCDVNLESSRATYKNGILDIELKKKKKTTETKGFQINIK
jgi:HSP20 family protein